MGNCCSNASSDANAMEEKIKDESKKPEENFSKSNSNINSVLPDQKIVCYGAGLFENAQNISPMNTDLENSNLT